ncbi:hypothetical protein D477_002121 [Arthrobacter crystallopoietes BAB-32]|uniref:Uncharacterized protein n=1 Tax=Arthrobacter crystallopoietes BAB-32 TaxID=1246476 RepID=N1V6X3_9MICC|nr:hypothetical protein [Arthrobacter crystallopoietes]EMY35842.1 hypothetical protein D477_002121 [Arthrobacter crystallopoietes BAB-32]
MDGSTDSGEVEGTTSAKARRTASNPAIWGLVGALLGSLITGIFSLQTAKTAAETSVRTAEIAQETAESGKEAEAARSRTDFLRTQRLNLYANLLTTSQIVSNEAGEYAHVLQFPESYPAGQVGTGRAELDTKYEAWVSGVWMVRVIASDEVSVANDNLATKLDEAYRLLAGYSGQSGELERIATYFQQFPNDVFALRTEFSTASQAEFEDPAGQDSSSTGAP